MKILIISFFSIFSIVSFTKEVSCSKHGTNVYYINGVLSKRFDEVSQDTSRIGEIYKNNLNLLDSQSNVSFIPIYNPSNGPINDIAELYAEDYYYRTGKDDGFSVFMQIYQSKLYQAANPSMLKKITQGGYLKQLKLKAERLKAMAAERKYSTSAMAVDQLKKINADVVNSVVSKMDDSIRASKKTLFVGHSQGNAVIKEAFKRTSTNSVDYQSYLKKFIGVFHVASPVQNLPSGTTNVRSFLLSNDWIVNLANYVFPEFSQSSATHLLISSNVSESSPDFDEFNHLFSNVYLTPNASAKSFSDNSVKDMRTIFKERLADLATDLADNCFDFDIVSMMTRGGYEYQTPDGSWITSNVDGNLKDDLKMEEFFLIKE